MGVASSGGGASAAGAEQVTLIFIEGHGLSGRGVFMLWGGLYMPPSISVMRFPGARSRSQFCPRDLWVRLLWPPKFCRPHAKPQPEIPGMLCKLPDLPSSFPLNYMTQAPSRSFHLPC